MLLLLLAATLGCSSPVPGPPGPEQAQPTLRVVSFNIRHGEGLDGRVDLERVARVLERLEPDVVLLQEVDRMTRRSGGIDQARDLAERTGLHHAFGAFREYDGGLYGVAMLSRHPLLETEVHQLPPGPAPIGALSALVAIGDPPREVVLCCVHLYRTAEQKEAQARGLVELFAAEQRPVILGGDLNSTRGSAVLEILSEHWRVPSGRLAPTYPADSPRSEIDFVLYRPAERLEVVESRVVAETAASDHRPVLLELTWR